MSALGSGARFTAVRAGHRPGHPANENCTRRLNRRPANSPQADEIHPGDTKSK